MRLRRLCPLVAVVAFGTSLIAGPARASAPPGSPAPAPPDGMRGIRPWLVIPCSASDYASEAQDLSYVRQLFTPSRPPFRFDGAEVPGYNAAFGSMPDYFSWISNGNVDLHGTVVTPPVVVPMKRADFQVLGGRYQDGRDDRVASCADALVRTQPSIDLESFYGVVAVMNLDSLSVTLARRVAKGDRTVTVTGAAPSIRLGAPIGVGRNEAVTSISGRVWTLSRPAPQALPKGTTVQVDGSDVGAGHTGPEAIAIRGTSHQLAVVFGTQSQSSSFWGHEMLHGFGLSHSRWELTPTTGYGDCYDIMSAIGCIKNFAAADLTPINASTYVPSNPNGSAKTVLAGPASTGIGLGATALTLDKLNWLPRSREVMLPAPATCSSRVDEVVPVDEARGTTQPVELKRAIDHAAAPVEVPGVAIPKILPKGVLWSVDVRRKYAYDLATPRGHVEVHLLGADGTTYLDRAPKDPTKAPGVNNAATPGGLVEGDSFVDAANRFYVGVSGFNGITGAARIVSGTCTLPTSMRITDSSASSQGRLVSGTLSTDRNSLPRQVVFVQVDGAPNCVAVTDLKGSWQCDVPGGTDGLVHRTTASFIERGAWSASTAAVTTVDVVRNPRVPGS